MSTEQISSTGSFRSILKSTSLIGGASILNILIGMIRTKFVAVLLGPAGVGLIAMYMQITTLIGTVTGMGISSSGVRQVAEAVGTQDDSRISRTVTTLRRTAWLTGGLGMLVMMVLCVPISRFTFANSDHAWALALLGVTLLLAAITSSQACVLRGTRRIADIAKITVIGAISGTMISVPCYYLWGERGIVVSLILSSMVALISSWWYARRIQITAIAMSWQENRQEARSLLGLGVSFMVAGIINSASSYAIQTILVRQYSLADVGIYQAAFSLSGVLVGFVLGAMGADYYPRLTSAAEDHVSVYRMVNEQSQVSILLALPGLAAMMIFAPMIIQLFYTSAFATAVPILRWCILGMFGRVISWPLGFVILAQGKGKLFLFTESLDCGVQLVFVFFFIRIWGLDGAGIAFMALYIFHTFLMLVVVRRLVGATWNWHTMKLTLFATIFMIALMLNCSLITNQITVWAVNIVGFVVVTWLCINQLSQQSEISLQTLLAKFRIKK